jgi:NCS2 family nucleobase:cation symporter-2
VRKLWLGWADIRGGRKPTRPLELLYSVDETPPRAVLILAALQHVALMSNSLVYPIILGREAHLSPEHLLDFVSLSMLALGVSTLLLCARTKLIGCGYLCPAAYTQIYLGPSLFAMQLGGLPLVFGMTAFAGILQLAMAPVLRRVRVLLPPEIAGLVIAIVGLSIAVLGVRYSLGVTPNGDVEPTDLVIAAVSLVTMVILNVWTKGYARMFCVLVGIAVGYGASAALGILDLLAAVPSEGLPLLRLPGFHFFEWRFDAALFAPFVIVALAGALHLMGNVSTAQRINDADWVRPNFGSLSRGLAGNGLASVICSLIGSLGVNSYSSSIGLSTATGITSRSVAYVIAIVFVLLALVPPAAAVFATIPAPVIGGALFFTAAFVFASGLQMITARLLDSRKIIVIGFSFAMAMIADIYHDVLAHAPVLLRPILDNALVLGTVCAVVLNLIMRIGVRKRVAIDFAAGHISRELVEQFLTEQGAHWAARRDILNRAVFGVVQSLDLLGNLPGKTEIDASFDEFNLDVRIRYAGSPIDIPERRPSPREIIASDEGERLLAGYLLRRSADRISSRKSGEGSEIHLHYDH